MELRDFRVERTRVWSLAWRSEKGGVEVEGGEGCGWDGYRLRKGEVARLEVPDVWI